MKIGEKASFLLLDEQTVEVRCAEECHDQPRFFDHFPADTG